MASPYGPTPWCRSSIHRQYPRSPCDKSHFLTHSQDEEESQSYSLSFDPYRANFCFFPAISDLVTTQNPSKKTAADPAKKKSKHHPSESPSNNRQIQQTRTVTSTSSWLLFNRHPPTTRKMGMSRHLGPRGTAASPAPRSRPLRVCLLQHPFTAFTLRYIC